MTGRSQLCTGHCHGELTEPTHECQKVLGAGYWVWVDTRRGTSRRSTTLFWARPHQHGSRYCFPCPMLYTSGSLWIEEGFTWTLRKMGMGDQSDGLAGKESAVQMWRLHLHSQHPCKNSRLKDMETAGSLDLLGQYYWLHESGSVRDVNSKTGGEQLGKVLDICLYTRVHTDAHVLAHMYRERSLQGWGTVEAPWLSSTSSSRARQSVQLYTNSLTGLSASSV